MIIIHENIQKEAEKAAEALKSAYGLSCTVLNENLDSVFLPIPEFNGFLESGEEMEKYIKKRFPEKIALVLTPRDLYYKSKSKEDDWIFGYRHEDWTLVASTARMKRKDNTPSDVLEVPEELYLRRVASTAIHEVGHDCIEAPHYKDAFWVNANTGYVLPLGDHCTDNRCVMYEIVDIRAPPAEEGHMLLGDEMKFDTGLDDVLERGYPGWFCDRCKAAIKISDKYK